MAENPQQQDKQAPPTAQAWPFTPEEEKQFLSPFEIKTHPAYCFRPDFKEKRRRTRPGRTARDDIEKEGSL